jgi:NAD(P)-dependent dehydrogenase (short-subunit alcohol dehydrogenase family)
MPNNAVRDCAVPASELSGLRALVTGGTAGIGGACARLLSQAGASVVIAGRDQHRGHAAAAELAARYIRTDLADLDSVHALVRQVGEVDVLVNNAASFPSAPTVTQDVAGFARTFDTNVRGTYFLTAGLAQGMLIRGRGAIVNVTSMVASKGVAGASAYSASKAAVESLTRTWAVEFASRGVRVNSVAPGPTDTAGVVAEWGDVNDELGRALPLGRTARAEEIAEAVLFLASPRSSFITGVTLHVDGGGTAI